MLAAMGARFVAVGEVMLDVQTDEVVPGAVVHAPVRVRAGGSPVTAALCAAAEGVESAVVGRVGDDLAGRAVRETLMAAGVEPLLQVDPELPTGTFFETGGGTIVADRGANARLEPGALAAEAVLVSGYFLLQQDGASLEGIRADWLAVDAGSARLLTTGTLDRLTGANALFVNEEEARALGDIDVLAARFRLVCVKRGAEGATAVLDGASETRRPPERVESERAGAGDAFAGALLASLLLGRDLGAALERACRAGALAAAG
jgi:sugar/nucleoside kinase (ribokinase family)